MALFSNISMDQLLSTWAADGGPSEDDKVAYLNAASDELENDEMVEKFKENVNQAATWANDIDASFDKVGRTFTDLVNKYGSVLPGIKDFKKEWTGYNNNWVDYLSLSRDVASENVGILKRFRQVYLEMVDSIKTVQDVKDVVLELQVFIEEKHDRATEMSSNFLSLKRDIEYFAPKLAKWIKTTGQELKAEAEQLQSDIDSLNSQIQAKDKQIEDATTALIACGSCLSILGVIVAGSVLAAFQSEKDDLVRQLNNKKKDLAHVNEAQDALPFVESEFNGMKPDIDLICERLVLFAQIWSSVRSQAVQIQTSLQGATGAPTDMGFKASIRLSKAMCDPLQDGLEKYAVTLENRQKQKAAGN
ncbi:hypothetical protein MD484_g6471, partial [Candolleomyces efflorescens]